MANNKVGVSGYGAVTPYGIGAHKSFSGLLSGETVFSEEHDLNLQNECYTQRKIASVPLAILENYRPDLHPRALATKMTLLSVEEALLMAGFNNDVFIPPERIGIAVTTLESEALEEIAIGQREKKDIGPFLEIANPEFCVNQIRRLTKATGPSVVLSNACASGNHAVAAGVDMILGGEVDVVIVGGGCKIFKSAVTGFHQFRGMATDTCRPFDLNRSGTMLGDGAGVLVLEGIHHAERRGFKPRIALSGYGTSCDAFDMIMQHPDGVGMTLCMERALSMAGVSVGDIQYINAHGTGTAQNDRLETLSIQKVFGPYADNLMVSSTKSLLGHNLYAASATEAVWCCCVLETGIVPGTWNAETPDHECNLDYVRNETRNKKVIHCINNSFGFGGSNASLVFSQINQ